MKKLLYSLMIAAATLVVGCSEPEGPNNGSGTGNNEFYGLAMDSADVTVVGADEYVIQMYNIATVEEQKMMTSIASAHVIIPGVSEDGIIPEGTYDIVAGEAGATPYYYKGSFYQDMYSSTPFDALLSGKLEVKHIAKGHRITILANGVNVETNATIKNLDFRYEGSLEFLSNETPMISMGAQDPDEPEPDPYFYYRGALSEDANLWELQILADATEEVVYYYDLYVITSLEGNLENGIPTGTYPLNLSMEAGSAIAAYYTKDGYIDGSMFVYETAAGAGLYDVFFGGELDVVNNGDGTYDLILNYYNYYSLPMTATYSGVATLVDYTDSVELYYGGDNHWNAYCYDMNFMVCSVLDVYTAADSTYADGLADGTYTVAATEEPMTIVTGSVTAEGSLLGSAFWALDFSKLYDVVNSGTMTVAKEGDIYTIELALEGEYGIEGYEWAYEGTVYTEDVSDAVAAANAGAAPLKVAEKQVPSKFATYRNCGEIHKSDVFVNRNRAF